MRFPSLGATLACILATLATTPAAAGEMTAGDVLRRSRIPSLVASGSHHPAIERMCDAVATALDAQRVVAPGAGHFVPAAPGFAEQLERFLSAAGAAR